MGHKILLADDSITVQKIVKLTFSDEGIEVIAVGNGELALQQLMDWQPDLVMADVFMPGRDGYEVCEFIKQHSQLNHIPVILLVHAFEPFDQARATQVKANCHLTKPFHSIRTLVTTVKELIQGTYSAAPTASVQPTTPSPAPESVIPTAAASAASSFAAQGNFSSAGPAYPAASSTPASSSVAESAFGNQSFAAAPQPEVSVQQAEVIPLQFGAEASEFTTSPVSFAQPEPMPSEQFESGQLLTFGNVNATPSDPLPPAPESFGLSEVSLFSLSSAVPAPAEPTVASPTENDIFSASPFEAPAPVTDNVISFAPQSFAAPVVDAASDEVLDLEEMLPPAVSVQNVEADLFAEVSSFAEPGFASATPGHHSLTSSSSDSAALPVLAEVEEEIIEAPVMSAKPAANSFADDSASVLEVPPVSFAAPEPPLPAFDAPAASFGTSPATTMLSGNPFADISAAPRKTQILSATEDNFNSPATTEAPGFGFSGSADFGTGSVEETPAAHSPGVSTFNTANFADLIPAAAGNDETPVAQPLSDTWAASPVSDTVAAPVESVSHWKQDVVTGSAAITTTNTTNGELTAQSISPALIDEIVNRVVAKMSEKAIQEIAWEVVPEMTELLLRKQLTERNH